MKESQLQDFGRAWQRHLRQITRCYELAAEICGGDLEVLATVQAHQQTVDRMPPLSVACLVLDDWGANIPDAILRKADCLRVNTPAPLEIQ